jgi:hypothetical protein
VDSGVSGWIFDALLLRVSMAGRGCISLDCARETHKAKTGSVSIHDRHFNSPWYLKIPESLAGWRITKDWLKWRPLGFDRWVASLDLVVQPFSGGDNRTSNTAAAILFGLIGIAMIFASALTGIWHTSAFALALLHRCLRGSSRF